MKAILAFLSVEDEICKVGEFEIVDVIHLIQDLVRCLHHLFMYVRTIYAYLIYHLFHN